MDVQHALTLEGPSFTTPDNTYTINMKHHLNCGTKGVIYFVLCGGSKIYVGMNTKLVRTDIVEYLSKIKNRVMNAPLVSHFVEAGYSESDFKYCVINKLQKLVYHLINEKKALVHVEAFWIFTLDTVMPKEIESISGSNWFL